MTPHERVIAMLVATFQPARWTEESTAAYVVALGDLAPDALHVAALELMRTSRFMPRPVELRQVVLEMAGDQAPAVETAWAEVAEAFGTVGRVGEPAFSHPVVARTVDGCGWRLLCDMDLTGARFTFTRAYERQVARAERDALVAPELSAGLVALPDLRMTRDLPEARPAQ
jgi:hypothetical protein